MEETKWLTKGKIIIMSVLFVLIISIVIGIVIHRNVLRKEYKEYEGQLVYAASNYLLKEKIVLYENEWRKINVDDILKQKLISNKRASDCKGYVIANAAKDKVTELEENLSNNDENSSENTSEENKKRVSNNISYKAYVSCKNIYITDGYGTTPDKNKENTNKTQSQKDTEKPTITLFGEQVIELYVGDEYKEAGASAYDNIDGDLTEKIIISGDVDTTKEGSYIVTYKVSDKAGNTATKKRKVNVSQKDDKNIDDDNVDEPDNSDDESDDDFDDDFTDDSSDDDYNTVIETPSNSNNRADRIAPTITFINPKAYQTICTGNSVNTSRTGVYGYIARDNIDGNITSKVSITGDTGVINSPGEYTIYYSVSDSSGNKVTKYRKFAAKVCSGSNSGATTIIVPTEIVLTPNAKTLNVSQTVQLSVSFKPGNVTDRSISYRSSNSSIATVSESGLVTANAKGQAVITARATNGKTSTCRIIVN